MPWSLATLHEFTALEVRPVLALSLASAGGMLAGIVSNFHLTALHLL